MYALIEKETNKILRTGAEYIQLADSKPFSWVDAPNNVTTAWTYDGNEFAAPPVVTGTPLTPEQIHNAEILDQIQEIENTITPRRLREAVLTVEGTNWLADKESQINTLRQQLK